MRRHWVPPALRGEAWGLVLNLFSPPPFLTYTQEATGEGNIKGGTQEYQKGGGGRAVYGVLGCMI